MADRRPRDLTELARENAELVAKALERAKRDSHGGLKSGHGAGRGSTNGDGTPESAVQRLAVGGRVSDDPVIRSWQRLVEHVKRTNGELAYLCGLDPEDAQKALLPAGAGWCVNPNCQRYCPGGPDRLRSGRCNRCRMFRSRNGGVEWQPEPLEETG